MNSAAPLLILAALVTSACSTHTMTNRRDLYTPTQASGPYSGALEDGTWKKGVTPKPVKASPAPAPQIIK